MSRELYQLLFRWRAVLLLAFSTQLVFAARDLSKETTRLYVAVDLSGSVNTVGLEAAQKLLQDGGIPETILDDPKKFRLVVFAGPGKTSSESRVIPISRFDVSNVLADYKKQHLGWGSCRSNAQMAVFELFGRSVNVCKSDFGSLFKDAADFFHRTPDTDRMTTSPLQRIDRNIMWIFSDGQNDPQGRGSSSMGVPMDQVLQTSPPSVAPLDLVLIYCQDRLGSSTWNKKKAGEAWDDAVNHLDASRDQVNFTLEPVLDYAHLHEELVERMIKRTRSRVSIDGAGCSAVQDEDKPNIYIDFRGKVNSSYGIIVEPKYTMWHEARQDQAVSICGGFDLHSTCKTFDPPRLEPGEHEISGQIVRQDLGPTPSSVFLSFRVTRPTGHHWEERSLDYQIPCTPLGKHRHVDATEHFEGVNVWYRPVKDHPFSVEFDSTFTTAQGHVAEPAPVGVYDASNEQDGRMIECGARQVPHGMEHAIEIAGRFNCTMYFKAPTWISAKYPVGLRFIYPRSNKPLDPVLIGVSDSSSVVLDKWTFVYVGPLPIIFVFVHSIFWILLLLIGPRYGVKAGAEPNSDNRVKWCFAIWLIIFLYGYHWFSNLGLPPLTSNLWPMRVRGGLLVCSILSVIGGALFCWSGPGLGSEKKRNWAPLVVAVSFLLFWIPPDRTKDFALGILLLYAIKVGCPKVGFLMHAFHHVFSGGSGHE